MIRAVFRILGRVAGVVAGGYLLIVALRGSRELVRPNVRAFEPAWEGAPATPADIGLDYEDVKFTTDDGVTLSGWYIPAARDTRTAVVVLHGFSGNRLPELAAFVPWLQERHHVLQFDFRGHGSSGPAAVTLGSHERRDVAAAVRFLESRGLGPIALFGISMGASTAIIAAPDLPVAAVVADAPFAVLHHPVANRMGELGYPLSKLGSRFIVTAVAVRTRTRLADPIRMVRRLAPRALLIIAPQEDRLIDWHQSEELFAAAREPKELYLVPGSAHADAYATDPEAYRARVLGFLERYLG
jgi:alpha-beta hydrolase superfamily lysophospholipase